ncbi:LysE family translocator [Bacillus sp. FJAT-42376]|uniref:LysE family translocator n=1 Tax=Bacillus sp. FJAT-42376 TaxID=2014076 RepID=UPI000F4D422F|nr:LysE family translocator [Bacillus sp. FJAT-42376]AZB41587.1 LysE family translocator [Bacillus sp. FJAT-42376]
MDFFLYLKGVIIGLSIAAPVGPIGLLCIQRTLSFGRMSGFSTGLGAASADAVYGLIAGLGLTVISDILIGNQIWFQLLGTLFLFYLGVKAFLSKPVPMAENASEQNIVMSYFSSFLLTLANPVTILSFAAIFGAFGIVHSDGTFTTALILVLGIFSGSALWWGILTLGAGWFRRRMKENALTVVNLISGAIMMIFGIYILAGVIYALS